MDSNGNGFESYPRSAPRVLAFPESVGAPPDVGYHSIEVPFPTTESALAGLPDWPDGSETTSMVEASPGRNSFLRSVATVHPQEALTS